jgi:hypothetical protein
VNRTINLAAAMLYLGCCATTLLAQDREESVPLAGHVYKSDGKPLAGARIFLFPLEAAVEGPLPAVVSGEDGSYHLTSPALGKTRVCASLERVGYPDTFYKVFASPTDHFPEVVLAPGAELNSVDIRLGPPDGLIEGTVIDKKTRVIVASARITLRWAEDSSVFMSAGVSRTGYFQYALPNRPISIEIKAPGYRPWTYSDPSTHAYFIELKSTDHPSLEIELEKAEPTSGMRP